LVERLSGRLICRECQVPFHRIANPFRACPHGRSRRPRRRRRLRRGRRLVGPSRLHAGRPPRSQRT
jgi:hypothetical protein